MYGQAIHSAPFKRVCESSNDSENIKREPVSKRDSTMLLRTGYHVLEGSVDLIFL